MPITEHCPFNNGQITGMGPIHLCCITPSLLSRETWTADNPRTFPRIMPVTLFKSINVCSVFGVLFDVVIVSHDYPFWLVRGGLVAAGVLTLRDLM